MKSIILSALLAVSLMASASGTKEKTVVTYRLSHNFNAEFGQVENVKWSSAMNDMTRADFVLDDEPVCAYFNEAGEFVAATKTITFKDLPKKLQNRILEKVPGATIETVFEMSSPEEKSWYIETNQNNEKKVWKGTSFGMITRYYVKH